jgi:hypothetical protein
LVGNKPPLPSRGLLGGGQVPGEMEGVMVNCPHNPFPAPGFHLKSYENLFCYFGPDRVVAVGRDFVIFVFGHQRFAHIVKQGGPEQIRITIGGTGLKGQFGVLGYIALSVVLFRLGSTCKGVEFWNIVNDSIPPPRITSSQFFFD